MTIDYTYDSGDNVATRKVNNVTDTFAYDPLDRLTIRTGSGTESYSYDHRGNRLQPGALYNDANELKSFTYLISDATGALHAVPVTSYTYDVSGNTTTITKASGIQTFGYNSADEMYHYTATGVNAYYEYDASGRRISKTVNNVTTLFSWEGSRLIAELDENQKIHRRYIYRGYTPLAMVEYHYDATGNSTHTPYYYVTDSLGTPWRMVDASGNVVWAASYSAFGEATTDPALTTVDQPLRMPGQYFDAESGLHYNLARYYSPELGRYLSVDPLRDAEDYAYANNNPLKYIDPDGEIAFLALAVLIIDTTSVSLAVNDLALFMTDVYYQHDRGEICTEDAIKKVGQRIGMDLAATAAGIGIAKAIRGAFSVVTAEGRAWQSLSREARKARSAAKEGALFRRGSTGVNGASEGQFWALENPITEGYARKYGLPKDGFNFVESGRVRDGARFITREAPGVGSNSGGAIEVVTGQGDVLLNSFNYLGAP